jgi:hypothetical protein
VILLGLCGAANSGKNTVAQLLPATRVIAFADPLYFGLASILGVTVETLQDRDFKEAVIPWIGKSPRQMLQTLGTEWGRGMVCDDLWVKIARRRIEEACRFVEFPFVVVTDVRFDNEAEVVREMGGEVWMVERPGASTCVPHESEKGISGHLVSRRIVNAGTLPALAVEVRTACERMVLSGKIKTSAA